jgi:hypothetical protein
MDFVFIEESEEDKAMEQQFVEAQIVHIDAREENIVTVEIQSSTKV